MFGKFMEFFPKDLNPFKIQTILKVDLLPEFLIQIMLGIWTSSQKHIYSFLIYLLQCQVLKFLELWKYLFSYFTNLDQLDYWKFFCIFILGLA
jgi:hypothetical protein